MAEQAAKAEPAGGPGAPSGDAGARAPARKRMRPAEVAAQCVLKDTYTLGKVLGSGSFATVYSCSSDPSVVIKRVDRAPTGSKGDRQVYNEIALLYKAGSHRNLVSFKGWYRDKENVICIVMGNCEGGTLASLLKAKAGGHKPVVEVFTEWQIMQWFCQILAALHHLHSRRIMHRDLKPDNIFLTKSRRTIKLGDLGVGRELESSHDMATTVMGTPYYMSPEVMAGRPYTYASDIWSLGCVLYEMAARRIAFDASGLPQLVVKVMRNEWEPLPTYYSSPFRRLVMLLLQPDPAARPTCEQALSARYVRECMEAYLTTLSPSAAAGLARHVFPGGAPAGLAYLAQPRPPSRIEGAGGDGEAVAAPAPRPRKRRAPRRAASTPPRGGDRPATSYLAPTGSSAAKAEEGRARRAQIDLGHEEEATKDVGRGTRKPSVAESGAGGAGKADAGRASAGAGAGARTGKRLASTGSRRGTVATMSVRTAKKTWEARAALFDLRGELAQRRWMAREMEAKRGRQMARIRQQEQEAQEQPPAEALAEAQMRGVRKAQQSILEDRLGATAAELGTAAAFATLDRLPRSMDDRPHSALQHRAADDTDDPSQHGPGPAAARPNRSDWAQFLSPHASFASSAAQSLAPRDSMALAKGDGPFDPNTVRESSAGVGMADMTDADVMIDYNRDDSIGSAHAGMGGTALPPIQERAGLGEGSPNDSTGGARLGERGGRGVGEGEGEGGSEEGDVVLSGSVALPLGHAASEGGAGKAGGVRAWAWGAGDASPSSPVQPKVAAPTATQGQRGAGPERPPTKADNGRGAREPRDGRGEASPRAVGSSGVCLGTGTPRSRYGAGIVPGRGMTAWEEGAVAELRSVVARGRPEDQWELVRAMWEVTVTTLGATATASDEESDGEGGAVGGVGAVRGAGWGGDEGVERARMAQGALWDGDGELRERDRARDGGEEAWATAVDTLAGAGSERGAVGEGAAEVSVAEDAGGVGAISADRKTGHLPHGSAAQAGERGRDGSAASGPSAPSASPLDLSGHLSLVSMNSGGSLDLGDSLGALDAAGGALEVIGGASEVAGSASILAGGASEVADGDALGDVAPSLDSSGADSDVGLAELRRRARAAQVAGSATDAAVNRDRGGAGGGWDGEGHSGAQGGAGVAGGDAPSREEQGDGAGGEGPRGLGDLEGDDVVFLSSGTMSETRRSGGGGGAWVGPQGEGGPGEDELVGESAVLSPRTVAAIPESIRVNLPSLAGALAQGTLASPARIRPSLWASGSWPHAAFSPNKEAPAFAATEGRAGAGDGALAVIGSPLPDKGAGTEGSYPTGGIPCQPEPVAPGVVTGSPAAAVGLPPSVAPAGEAEGDAVRVQTPGGGAVGRDTGRSVLRASAVAPEMCLGETGGSLVPGVGSPGPSPAALRMKAGVGAHPGLDSTTSQFGDMRRRGVWGSDRGEEGVAGGGGGEGGGGARDAGSEGGGGEGGGADGLDGPEGSEGLISLPASMDGPAEGAESGAESGSGSSDAEEVAWSEYDSDDFEDSGEGSGEGGEGGDEEGSEGTDAEGSWEGGEGVGTEGEAFEGRRAYDEAVERMLSMAAPMGSKRKAGLI